LNYKWPGCTAQYLTVCQQVRRVRFSLKTAAAKYEALPPLLLRGRFHVQFPFQPYPVQVIYMEKVLEALETAQNALLESPTGTGLSHKSAPMPLSCPHLLATLSAGKTLCLLCSSLSWLEATLGVPSQAPSPPAAPMLDTAGDPLLLQAKPKSDAGGGPSVRVIYCSRTHSQLQQVARELKRTSYAVPMTLLGSREQLCIHPKVRTRKRAGRGGDVAWGRGAGGGGERRCCISPFHWN